MSLSPHSYRVHVTGGDPRSIEEALNGAVEAAIEHALGDGTCGVLVTRLDPRSYTVELSQDVPFGTTLEADESAEGRRDRATNQQRSLP